MFDSSREEHHYKDSQLNKMSEAGEASTRSIILSKASNTYDWIFLSYHSSQPHAEDRCRGEHPDVSAAFNQE